MSLTIDVISNDAGHADRVRVSLIGRLDGTTAPWLEEALKPVLAGTARSVILDFENVDFISSMGIRVVVMSQKALARRDGSVVLVNMKPQIRKVIEIIEALPGLSVFRDMQEMDDYLTLMQQKASGDDE